MKTVLSIFLAILLTFPVFGQAYNQEKVSLTNFLVRMYENAPFEGVKAIRDYDNDYLMSVVKLDKGKYKTESALIRVASVKAMSQASQFLNGSNITEELIIKTTDKADGTSDSEIIENIRQNSIGYVKQLEQLTNFPTADNFQVFIFISPLGK